MKASHTPAATIRDKSFCCGHTMPLSRINAIRKSRQKPPKLRAVATKRGRKSELFFVTSRPTTAQPPWQMPTQSTKHFARFLRHEDAGAEGAIDGRVVAWYKDAEEENEED